MIRITQWHWSEAFNKFGFEDGDGWNGTDLVTKFLKEKFDYDCEVEAWGCHNYMIFDILDKNNNSIIKKEYTAGYDDPSDYLPKDVIDALKEEFPYHDYCTDKLHEELNNKLTEEIR